jgi:phosphatidylglycerol---prolipoprotein diacylglyceryl transferase
VYPILFRIGSFEITSFGAMVALAAIVGVWIFERELKRSALPADAVDAAIFGVLGGLVGAKLIWVVEHAPYGPIADLLFSRSGLSWFGGLAGGVATGLLVMHRRRLPKIAVVAAATPALAVGHAIGRIGCFLVGDDYGVPTTLPWGVAFPQGAPPTLERVHPTQLYEMFALLVLAWLLVRWRHRGTSDAVVLGRYLVCAAAIRFAIQFLRADIRVLGPFGVAHFVSLLAILAGTWFLAIARPARTRSS